MGTQPIPSKREIELISDLFCVYPLDHSFFWSTAKFKQRSFFKLCLLPVLNIPPANTLHQALTECFL